MLSSSSLHAGHLALSTLWILLRYPSSGMSVILSCAIVLAIDLKSLGLLNALRNLFEGVVSSIFATAFSRLALLHSFLHSLLRLSLCVAFTAVRLVRRGFLRYGGRSLVSDVRPLAASFASLSANSLPSNPLCPAVQRIVIIALLLVFFFFFSILLAICKAL